MARKALTFGNYRTLFADSRPDLFAHYEPSAREITFERDEIVRVAAELGMPLPKNLGDVVYSFRYRASSTFSQVSRAIRCGVISAQQSRKWDKWRRMRFI